MIPKKLHFVSLPSHPLTPVTQGWRPSWLHHHPDWRHRSWSPEEVAALPLPPRAAASRSPLRRWLAAQAWILHHEGGVAVHPALECLRPLDPLLPGCEGFVTCTAEGGRVGTDLFGASAGHELTLKLLGLLAKPRFWHRPEQLVTKAAARLDTVRRLESGLFVRSQTQAAPDGTARARPIARLHPAVQADEA
jgi:mannosyltransferase OCH1-like enzyme